MAARLTDSLGVEARLIAAGGGVFDVVVDGELVYSKFETGEFPDNELLTALLLDRGRGG